MCHSAQVRSDYRRRVREFQAKVHTQEFYDLFYRRSVGSKLVIPRGVEDSFSNPQSEQEQAIWDLVLAHRQQERTRWEQELFAQKTRLALSERKVGTCQKFCV